MSQIQDFTEKVVPNIEKVIVGKRNSVELAVIGMLCQGHLLIIGVLIQPYPIYSRHATE
jgi:MoxR-like ATPase